MAKIKRAVLFVAIEQETTDAIGELLLDAHLLVGDLPAFRSVGHRVVGRGKGNLVEGSVAKLLITIANLRRPIRAATRSERD